MPWEMKAQKILCIVAMCNVTIIHANIPLCTSGIQSKVCKVVEKAEDYVAENSPAPLPTYVTVAIQILDIIDVDEDSQTITLQLRVRLQWIDKMLAVNRSKSDLEQNIVWYVISLDDLDEIWTPSTYIGNSVSKTSPGTIGNSQGSLNILWFGTEKQELIFYDKQITTFTCHMTFEEFPFDSHECRMQLIVWIGATYRVQLIKPTLYVFDSEIMEQVSGAKVKKSSKKLGNYAFEFEAMEPSKFLEISVEYSMVEIKVRLNRTDKGRSKIFSSYHATTGALTLLSLVSFFIKADQVPGRMALLITLCLIMINFYNSVDAPSNRGFSSIELWFVGTLMPVMFGLLEFGLVLALQKFGHQMIDFCDKSGVSQKTLLNSMDFASFVLTIVYIACFNVFFWS